MNLIDSTYFNREINIPGVEKPLVSGPLSKFIKEYEPRFLQKALGYEFYTEFWAAMEAGSSESMWTEIVEGGTFTHCGKLVKWDGLRASTELKESIIANYVYYFFMRDNVSMTTGIGEVKSKSENSASASAAPKMCKAWNDMVRQLHVLWNFLQYKTDDDGEKVYDTFDCNAVEHCHFGFINSMGI